MGWLLVPLLLALGGCAVMVNVVVAPLPAPAVEPLPEDVRTLLWVAGGGEPGDERRLGLLPLVRDMAKTPMRGGVLGTPQGQVPCEAARAWVVARGYSGHADWHLSNLRTSLRIARWWPADEALDYAGAQLHERAGAPLDTLDLEQIAVLVVRQQQGARYSQERARHLLSRLVTQTPPRLRSEDRDR